MPGIQIAFSVVCIAVVCNSIMIGKWYELMVVCVCHSDEVMREADANDTSGELGSAFSWSLMGESTFVTAKLESRVKLPVGIDCS